MCMKYANLCRLNDSFLLLHLYEAALTLSQADQMLRHNVPATAQILMN